MNLLEKAYGRDAHEKRQAEIALTVVTLASFLAPFAVSSTNVALPRMAREFSLGAITLSWVSTAYLLTSAVFVVPLGRAADIYGRKSFFLTGLCIFTLASFLLVFASSELMLISFRALQGTGSAFIFATNLAILTSIVKPGERGKALGIAVSATYTGLALGPFLGGLLCGYFGWRSIYLVNVPLGLFLILLTAKELKGEWAGSKGEPYDYPGAFLYSLSLVGLTWGVINFSIMSVSPVAILAGISGFLLFFLYERRQKKPVIDLSLFTSNRVFAFSSLAALLNYSATYATGFLMSLYLQFVKGLSSDLAGAIMMTQPVFQALLSPLAGKLSDRFEPRYIASTGMALVTGGLLFFSTLKPSTGLFAVFICFILTGTGFGLFTSPNTSAAMGAVPKKAYGVASSIVGTMRLLGQLMSMTVATIFLAGSMGSKTIEPQNIPCFMISMRRAFHAFAFLCFLGIFASLSRGNNNREGNED